VPGQPSDRIRMPVLHKAVTVSSKHFLKMTELECFYIIDDAIRRFKDNEGFQKRIKVDSKPNSDWFLFNWRQLTWQDNGLEYLIEIYPQLDKFGNSIAWSLYSAVYYDSYGKRYYLKHTFLDESSLEFIADNITELLVSSFKYISCIQKDAIPISTRLE